MGAGFSEGDGVAIDLSAAKSYYWKKQEEAARTSNLALVEFWGKQFLRADKAQRDNELHAQKMGIDEGQIIPRADFSRLCHALAFWFLRGIDGDNAELAGKILDLQHLEVAHDVLDRYFMRNRFLGAFQKAISQESGVSLPRWAYSDLKAAVDAYFEVDPSDGEDVVSYDAFLVVLREMEGGDAKKLG